MAIRPDQLQEIESRLARNRSKPIAAAPEPAPAPTPAPPSENRVPVVFADLSAFDSREFTYKGSPIGKPRMTRRDKFRKRPCVIRYRDFADNIRVAAGELPPNPDMVLVTAYVEVKPSWPLAKKLMMAGNPCRSKPDWDNIGKAVCDALFDEDQVIWLGLTVKYWCASGDQRLNVKVLYAKPS